MNAALIYVLGAIAVGLYLPWVLMMVQRRRVLAFFDRLIAALPPTLEELDLDALIPEPTTTEEVPWSPPRPCLWCGGRTIVEITQLVEGAPKYADCEHCDHTGYRPEDPNAAADADKISPTDAGAVAAGAGSP